jgi:hypothetical protein
VVMLCSAVQSVVVEVDVIVRGLESDRRAELGLAGDNCMTLLLLEVSLIAISGILLAARVLS